jgi:RHS repeat-associated protein
VSELRYLPFGETRWMSGTTPTDRRFTGQREVPAIGLYDYNARMYWPGAGRFVSADTVVPGPGNPQMFNRYAYALNSPLRFIDLDGHAATDPAQQEAFRKKLTASLNKSKLWAEMLRMLPRNFLEKNVKFVFEHTQSGTSLPRGTDGKYIIVLPHSYGNAASLLPEEASLVAHEVFHTFQREMAERNGGPDEVRNKDGAVGIKHASARVKFLTNNAFEREAYIFGFSVLAELVGIKDFRSNPAYKWQREGLAAMLGTEKEANTWLEKRSGLGAVYKTFDSVWPDPARAGATWEQLMTNYNYKLSKSAMSAIRQAGGQP